jgi:RNA polymerase sigma factor (sigma-70 family)
MLMEYDLILKASNGNDDAFNILVQPYIKRSHQTAYLLLHDKNLAEDAVQEALIELYKSIKKFDIQKATFKTWFNRIVINTTLKIARKRRFLSYFDFNGGGSDSKSNPEEIYMLREETQLVINQLKLLNRKHSTIIILHYFQELSVKEIASTLNISEGTVKSRLHTARTKLKSMLSSEDSHFLFRRDVLWKED